MTFPMIASNASTVFPARFLRASASMFNYFFKAPSFFGVDNPEVAGPPPPKTTGMANTIVEMVIKRAVSIDTIVIP